MADVRPLRALRYNLAAVGSLADVIAPPYDVVGEGERERLVARSPFNAVELDLPVAPAGADPYEHAAETLQEWILQGVLVQEREPSLWVLEQDYTGPDGARRTRRGLLARVRVTGYGPGLIRPHERTQPGPKEDRLLLTRATRHNLSPIFCLDAADAWSPADGALGEPWAEAADEEGVTNRIWRLGDPGIHGEVAAALAPSELLIADGHHRYETALAYAEEVGGEGEHRYTLACLVAMGDPGLTVFGYHRLLTALEDPGARERLAAVLRERFDAEEVAPERLDPAGEPGIGVFGFIEPATGRCLRLRLRAPEALAGDLPGRSEAYRRLDAAILEAVVLRGALGMSEEDVEAKRGISYTASAAEALEAVRSGTAQAAFLLRPTPIEQVRAVAAAGETMPPKSTFFYPKVPTGIVFNPLS